MSFKTVQFDTLQNLKDNYIQPIFDIEFECVPNDLKFKIQNSELFYNIINFGILSI